MDTMKKNNILGTLADLLVEHKQDIIRVNRQDLAACPVINVSMLDRLKIDEDKILGMVTSIRQVIALRDPEGRTLYSYQHENGLEVRNKAVSFGTILIIYESRPDVTIEAAITAFKAGNKILLKGGRESRKTNLFLVDLWRKALSVHGVDCDFVSYLDYSREEMQDFIQDSGDQVDLIIPRGGESLIHFVRQHARAPVIVSGRGNNFLYVDRDCDFDMAIKIILNGKQRISVCNALDKVLIHQDLPRVTLCVSKLITALENDDIEVLGDEQIFNFDDRVEKIQSKEVFNEEFLSSKILLSLVGNLDEAIDFINTHSGGHSASIVTTNFQVARVFQDKVDCAAVYHNTSTRFTDGGQFGVGAEMAISTQKLHFRGPVGLDQLVTNKWFVSGKGQVRE